ncbi:MAG: hypothetical protein ACXWLJ_06110, partial [Rhizomicrobium sp.]
KATMDVPSPSAGKLKELRDKLGDKQESIGPWLVGVESCLKSIDSGVTHAALGGKIDKAGNAVLDARALFNKDSSLAKLAADLKPLPDGALAGLPAGPYAMAFGDHAELAGLNLIGLKRRGLSRETIHALRGAFKQIFYGEGGDIKSRATAMKAQFPDVAEVGEIVEFILAPAKQKLCTARRRGDVE